MLEDKFYETKKQSMLKGIGNVRLLEEEDSAEGVRAKALRFPEVHLVCFINCKKASMARAEGTHGE